MLPSPKILLIISGGIAAYKALDLIRRLKERGIEVRAIMTRGAREFVTPLSVGALTGGKVFTELFDHDDEQDVGHIRIAREAELVVVAPATADILAKMAGGHADDLATAVLLATKSPILVAPAMNPAMWAHPATQAEYRDITRRWRPFRRSRTGRDGGGRRGGPWTHGRAARHRRGRRGATWRGRTVARGSRGGACW